MCFGFILTRATHRSMITLYLYREIYISLPTTNRPIIGYLAKLLEEVNCFYRHNESCFGERSLQIASLYHAEIPQLAGLRRTLTNQVPILVLFLNIMK